MEALQVVPPEIKCHCHREKDRELIRHKVELQMKKLARFVSQTTEILAGADAADRARQYIVEHQRGNGKPRNERPHSVADHYVYAAAYEHAAAFHVDGTNGEAEQHYAE